MAIDRIMAQFMFDNDPRSEQEQSCKDDVAEGYNDVPLTRHLNLSIKYLYCQLVCFLEIALRNSKANQEGYHLDKIRIYKEHRNPSALDLYVFE